MTPVEPHSWIGLVGVLSTVGASITVAVLSARGQRGLNAVREQVQNSHGTNLRDDLDRIMAAVKDLSRDVSGLREEMRTERLERIAGDQRP